MRQMYLQWISREESGMLAKLREVTNIAQATAYNLLKATYAERRPQGIDGARVFAQAQSLYCTRNPDRLVASAIFSVLGTHEMVKSEPPQIYHDDFEVELYFLQWSKGFFGCVIGLGVQYDASDEEFLSTMILWGQHGPAALEWMKVWACSETLADRC